MNCETILSAMENALEKHSYTLKELNVIYTFIEDAFMEAKIDSEAEEDLDHIKLLIYEAIQEKEKEL